jgi:hypothetical protein
LQFVFMQTLTHSFPLVVIGTSNAVLLSIGGDASQASIPLGAFIFGSAVISCGFTAFLFRRVGRRYGFFFGIALGILASLLGMISLICQSTALYAISSFFFGTANGIGYYLRFAVMENVPAVWASRAVTLVVSGGVMAAFAGPELGHATRGIFGDSEHITYVGVFIMALVLNVANIVFVSLVQFAPLPESINVVMSECSSNNHAHYIYNMYKALLSTRNFTVPLLRSMIGWVVMAVPMSVLGIAMQDAGFSSRQSLLVMELHFCSLYAPGFVSGNLIHRYGVRAVCFAAWIMNCLAIALLLTCRVEGEGVAMVHWCIGMMVLGIGWNFQFASTTVWLNAACCDLSFSKVEIQCANDFLMFLISGAWIFGASFVYDVHFWGVGSLSGWMTLNYCMIGFLIADFVIILFDLHRKRIGVASTPGRISDEKQANHC